MTNYYPKQDSSSSAKCTPFMPKDKNSIAILEERAKKLAQSIMAPTERQTVTNYVHFKLGAKQDYGIEYQYICEVLAYISYTKIPNTPDYVTGIINYRGSLIALINLSRFFNIMTENISPNKENPLIITTCNGVTIAYQVSEIIGDEQYFNQNLESPLQCQGALPINYIAGLHKSSTTIASIIAVESLTKEIENFISKISRENTYAKQI